MLDELGEKAKGVNVVRLTFDQRRSLMSRLKPVIAFYTALKTLD
jgi:hypothetical protein